jgi:hypothetical protein
VRNHNKPTLVADLLACCWRCWLAVGRSAASWRLKKTEESKRDTEREGRIRLERQVRNLVFLQKNIGGDINVIFKNFKVMGRV